MRRARLVILLVAGCNAGAATQAGPAAPARDLWCVTKGAAAIGGRISQPTVRAVDLRSSGHAATLKFRFHGDAPESHAFASGQLRRQLGLKLRAQNSCNLIYVMWRLDPRPKLEVSVKQNRGARTHEECGTSGYQKLKLDRRVTLDSLPSLVAGQTYALRAEIAGNELSAWVDDRLVWRGALPDAARDMVGPSGLRSDNLVYDLISFSAPPGAVIEPAPKCVVEDGD